MLRRALQCIGGGGAALFGAPAARVTRAAHGA